MILYGAIFTLLTIFTLALPYLAIEAVFFSFSFEQLLRAPAGTFPVPVRFTQWITLVLFGLLVVCYGSRLKLPKFRGLSVLFSLYILINAISLTYTPDVSISMRQFIILLLAGITALTYSLWITNMALVNRVLRAMYWGAVLHFVSALIQLGLFLTLGWEIGYPKGMGMHLKVRTFGWMFEPNWLGVFIVVVFPWFLFALDYGRQIKITRTQAYIGLGLLALTLFLNMSRLAWIAVAIQAFLWMVSSAPHFKRYVIRAAIWAIPVILLVLVAWFMLPPVLQASFFDRFTDVAKASAGSGSVNVRLTNYKQLWDFFQESPWIGHGIGTWPVLTGHPVANAIPTTTYLYIMVEVGVIGAGILLAGIIGYMFSLYDGYRKCSLSLQRYYLYAACLSVIGILITGFFVDIKTLFSYFPVFGLYWGLLKTTKSDRKAVSAVPSQVTL